MILTAIVVIAIIIAAVSPLIVIWNINNKADKKLRLSQKYKVQTNTLEYVYTKTYNDIYNTLQIFGTSQVSFETHAFLLVISDFIHSQRQDRTNLFNAIHKLQKKDVLDEARMDRRLQQYGKVISGEIKVRGESMQFQLPENITPHYQAFVFFCDLLYNPACQTNYGNAPAAMYDAASAIRISSLLVDAIFPIVADYIKFIDIYDCKNHKQKPY